MPEQESSRSIRVVMSAIRTGGEALEAIQGEPNETWSVCDFPRTIQGETNKARSVSEVFGTIPGEQKISLSAGEACKSIQSELSTALPWLGLAWYGSKRLNGAPCPYFHNFNVKESFHTNLFIVIYINEPIFIMVFYKSFFLGKRLSNDKTILEKNF